MHANILHHNGNDNKNYMYTLISDLYILVTIPQFHVCDRLE